VKTIPKASHFNMKT